MPRYKNQEEFFDVLREQIEEHEASLSLIEKIERQNKRESNNKAVKKYMQTVDIVRVRLDNDKEDENDKTQKEIWKESAQYLGKSMNAMVVEAVEEYLSKHKEEAEENKKTYEAFKKKVTKEWEEELKNSFWDGLIFRTEDDLNKMVKRDVHAFVSSKMITLKKDVEKCDKLPAMLIKELEKELEEKLKERIKKRK